MAEDKKLAALAVIVTGLVGICAPIITWVATRDAQDATTRSEIVRTDRAELRSVLERSVAAMDKSWLDMGLSYDAWSKSDRGGSARLQAPLKKNQHPLTINQARLQLRL